MPRVGIKVRICMIRQKTKLKPAIPMVMVVTMWVLWVLWVVRKSAERNRDEAVVVVTGE